MPKDRTTKDVLAPRSSKVTKSAPKAKVPKAATAYKSADRITESDDEDMEDASELASQPATATSVPNTDADDSAIDDDDSDTNADALSKDAARKRIEQLAQEDASEDEESESEQANAGAENVDEDGNEDEVMPKASTPKPLSKSTTVASSSKETTASTGRLDNEIDDAQLRPTVEFRAPSGFRAIKDEIISSHTDLFQPANTRDKEIWYISAPASLPITALQEVALEKFAKHEAIMTHNGEDYALVADPAARDNTRVLLPGKKTGYRVIQTPVKHVLQFQQIVGVQATASKGRPKTTSQVLLDTDLPTKPAKKVQPPGLRMRLRPSGFGDGYLGQIGSSDEEEELPSALALGLSSGSGLDKRKAPEATSVDQSGKKKKKKDKQPAIETPGDVPAKHQQYVTEALIAIDADQETAPAEAVSKEGKKKKKKDKKGVENATDLEPVGEPMNGETIGTEHESVPVGDVPKSKKEKKKKHREAEDDARAINETAVEIGVGGGIVDEGLEKKKKKKDKKIKREASQE